MQIKDVVITMRVTKIVDNSELNNYDSIKLLSKSIKEKLKDSGIEIQHNKLLNIIWLTQIIASIKYANKSIINKIITYFKLKSMA